MKRLTALFTRTAGELARAPRLICTADTPLQELLTRMRECGCNHAVVLREQRQLRGLITPHSLIRHLGEHGHGLATARAADAMEPAPTLVSAAEPLYRLTPAFHSDAPLLVVTESGALHGLIQPQDLLRLLAAPALSAGGVATTDLAALKRDQETIARELLSEGMTATDIQQVLTAMNDDLCRRAVDAVTTGLELDGWGRPPVPFCLLLMGSGGRAESLLAPDQDNGLILDDYPDTAHGTIDRYFAEFALRLTHRLDEAGLPLCPGHVMASNPLWRKTRTQWRGQLQYWIRHRSPQALLNASILLDMRGNVGEPTLAEELREAMLKSIAAAPGFLRALLVNESVKQVGLGWFDHLQTEGDDSPHAGQFNLKRNGMMPLVEAVRLYALAAGINASSTVNRLAGLRAAGKLDTDEHDALCEAFEYLCTLQLRQQLADLASGRPAGRHVPPEALTRREQEQLVRSLKTAEALLRTVRHTLLGGDTS